MTQFRVRRYGSADWVDILLEGEDEELVEELSRNFAAGLQVDGLHAQQLEEGNWEDLE